jgi:ubiquinol-cytochrome c reductase cytochrome b subunit
MKAFWHALEQRLPVQKFLKKHLLNYQVPRSLNFWYVFGLLALIFMVNQYISGMWLTMFYVPTISKAFFSVQSIMHEVPSGWFIRYLHTTGASFLFIVMYLHMVRGFLYGSYHKPRELVWVIGVLLLAILYIQSFLGYVLPWGQMSFWGAEVVTSALKSVPWIGDGLVQWIRGGSEVGGPLLQRFFALHVVIFPILILYIIKLHVVAIRYVGSSTPVKTSTTPKTMRFFPDHLAKEAFAALLVITLFFAVVFFFPTLGGIFIEHLNAIPADRLITPSPIHPPWYLTPYFAILRSVPDLFLGLLITAFAFLVWFLLPLLDRSRHRLLKDKSVAFKVMLILFGLNFITLGILGWYELSPLSLWISRCCSVFYFIFFITMPFFSRERLRC